MPPKKKDPNQPILVAEDAFQRSKKLVELKIAPKQPKPGVDLTIEELCVPPQFHSLPEFKSVVQYWNQGGIVKYAERHDLKPPSRIEKAEAETGMMKTHPRKEIQDMLKFLKGQVKNATKRTGQFLKQLEKKEKKEEKRQALLKQIEQVEESMNEELRQARRFAAKQEIFEPKYAYGSKLASGKEAPKERVLLALELSEKQAPYLDEALDEMNKFLATVIEKGPTDTVNIVCFSTTGCVCWMPSWQSKNDPKKGLPDAVKWLKKTFNAKTAAQSAYPPDWLGFFNKFLHADGQQPPSKIFLTCSRSPQEQNGEVLDLIKDHRTALEGKAASINVVAFDPTIVGDATEDEFFTDLCGPQGQFLIDTTQDDLVALDKMLTSVKGKKKNLEKLEKKLDKLEDLEEPLNEDRSLLNYQISLQKMLENDYELCDYALRNELAPPGPTI